MFKYLFFKRTYIYTNFGRLSLSVILQMQKITEIKLINKE